MSFEENKPDAPEFEEEVVFVNRCAKVVKGGRRFSFSAVIVVGDRNGQVGLGFGKANEVSEAIRKGTEAAKRNLVTVTMKGKSIPHAVTGQWDGGRVLLMPASEGTGVIAGGGMRAVLEKAGYQDILAKSQGSKNRLNVVKATFDALSKLRTEEQIRAERANA
ncbi:MAG: 30S ribosomal protein S5 [Kiritimatiellia bacterium]|jgi:small subunit ribosomal protein S5